MYLTPARFRAMGFGVKVDDLIDAELNRYLQRAATALHIYTAAPTLPVPHDFRGGSIVGETHTWPIDQYEREPRRRVFPYHSPVIDVTRVAIHATADQYLEFDADQIYYEASEGWIEPASASLTSYGLFGAAMLPFIGLAHPHVSLDYTYGRRIPTTERLYYSDAAYTWRGATGFWKTGIANPVVVRKNNAVVPEADYVVDAIEGTIRFTQNFPVDGDTIDADYVASLPWEIPEAQGLIAAAAISEKRLTPIMGGLRALRVAELSMERDYRRSSDAAAQVVIPNEAAALLDPFIFRGLAFG